MSKLLSLLAKPVTAPVAASRRSVAAMTGPLKQHIDLLEAKGEDITVALWHEYVGAQRRLLPYRVARFSAETAHLASGALAIATLSRWDLLAVARFGTKLLALFLAAVLVGRRSIYPPLEPTSAFVSEVVENWPSSHVDAAFGRVPAETIHYLKELRAQDLHGYKIVE